MKILVFLLTIISSIISQTVQIYVDKNKLQEGELLSLTIEANGTEDFPTIDLKPLENDFEIISGPSQQTNIQWINGQMNNTKKISWTLSPKKTGRIFIPSLIGKIGNKSFKGKPISINIVKTDLNTDKSVFIKADFDKKEVYLGEQITLTYKLYKQIDITISSIDQLEMPEFKGFWVEEIFTPQRLQYKSKTETINGVKYQVANLGQKALFPITSSDLIIPKIIVKIKIETKKKKKRRDPFFDPFFNSFFTETTTKILKSKQNKIIIKPFPDPKPLDFNGAVGNFKISSTSDMDELEINNGFTFTVLLNGSGNIGLFSLPEINFPEGLEVFPPSDNFTKDVFRNQLTGSQSWEYIIIPRKIGITIIPKIQMSFFDPTSSSWKRIQTNPLPIKVLNNDKNSYANSGLTKKEIKLIGQDIRFIHTNINKSLIVKILNGNTIIILYICSIIIFILPSVITRFIGYHSFNAETRQKRSALKKSIKLLQGDENDVFNIASNALYVYLKIKFVLPSYNLDPFEVQKILDGKISNSLINEIIELLQKCDAGKFSKEHTFDKNKILNNMKDILIRLDKEFV